MHQRPKRPQHFAPPATAASYRDVLRFEQRLVQNAERLQQQRRKYELFLAGLVLAIFAQAYYVLVEPSIYSLVRYLQMGLLMIFVTALILFFATGIYTEKIARAYKFVPQANRSLRSFNLYLNARRPKPWYLFGLFGNYGRSAPSRSSTLSNASSPTRSPPTSPERRSVPLAPPEPPHDMAGELIFSNRVDPHFQQGYAAFRTEWKRRRSEQKVGNSVHVSATNMAHSADAPPSPPISAPPSIPNSPTSRPRSRSRSPSPLSVGGPRSLTSAATTDEESGPPSPAPEIQHIEQLISKSPFEGKPASDGF